MGDADPRLRWHRLHGLSSEVKASIDGGVIQDTGFELRAAFVRLFLLTIFDGATSVVGTNRTCRVGLTMSVDRGRPEVARTAPFGRKCRVGPGNFTPSLSQVGSRTGAPV